jgi:hypothetical protein
MLELEAKHCNTVAEPDPGSEPADDRFEVGVISLRIKLAVAELLSALSVFVEPGDDRLR